MGLQSNNVEKDIADWVTNDEENELKENGDPCCTKQRLLNEEKSRIRKPWRQTLIIKLFGRFIGYKTLF